MTAPPRLSPAGQRALLDDIQRRSLLEFHKRAFAMLHPAETMIVGPHLEAMVYKLEQFALGNIKRLIIGAPPRHGKSELASGSFPAWVLGNDPTAKVTIASYAEELSSQLSDKARLIIKDEGYRSLFPNTRVMRGHDRAAYLRTTAGGEIKAASKLGTMTGLGTHFLIIDDWHKASESLSLIELDRATEIFKKTYLNRFENLLDGRILILMQRIHDEDLIGWALRHGHWDYLRMPAIAQEDQDIPLGRGRIWHFKKGDVLAPKIASRDYLAEQELIFGKRDYAAQFLLDTYVPDGAIFNMGWFDQYDERPARDFFHKVVQSCDPAATPNGGDYSVIMTWGFRGDTWYLLDLVRVQVEYHHLCDRLCAEHRRWKADALVIEGGSIGDALFSYAKRELPGIIRAPRPRASKVDRAVAVTAQLAKGKFLIPRSADWRVMFDRELTAFPDWSNDDIVDALTMFLGFVFDARGWVETRRAPDGRRFTVRRPRQRRRYDDEDPTPDPNR